MAEWIRSGEVDVDDLPNLVELGSFSSDQVEAIKMALGLGWSLIFTSRESMTLVPYGERPGIKGKRIHISAKKPVPLHRMMKQIRRGGDPALTKRLDDIARRMHESTDPVDRMKAALEWEEAATVEVDQTAVVEIMTPEFEKPKERFVKPAAVPTPTQVAERVEKERHIVSERPAMMHRGLTKQGGQSYPSKTTLERRWSDGTIEYVCAVPDCESPPSQNRLSFRGAHYAMHVRKGDAPALDGEEQKNLVHDPDYTEPAWSRKDGGSRRLDGLINLLKGINLAEMSPEDLAAQIEEWLKTLYGNAGGGQAEPLTAEQIIDRIRTLVDTGKYADQEKAIQEQAQQMEDLMKYAEQREAELEAAILVERQRAIKSESHLAALRDLINETAGA